ncbi:alpha/beta hydrolase [Streptomyces sp. NPDC020983]|uniref:alpha/beta hydrolase n=1 Tax=Streptomyces sp. NPDC020983 TaxID=3365106 RepID=UPI0037B52B48
MNRTPVVFIHGAWLHARVWEPWAELFATRGFLAFAPGWPEDAAARQGGGDHAPAAGLGLDELTDHYARFVRSLDVPPVLIGHSVGGLIAQHLLGADVGRAAVAIAPAPVNGVPLPASRTGLWAPDGAERADRLVPLSAERFHQVFANTAGAQESGRLFERYVVPAPRRLLADLGCAGTPRSPRTAADVTNTRRGPLLLVSGQEDLLVPDVVTRTVYKQYGDSTAVTDLKQFADRAHSLIIDGGWPSVAGYVLGWLGERGLGTRPAQG